MRYIDAQPTQPTFTRFLGRYELGVNLGIYRFAKRSSDIQIRKTVHAGKHAGTYVLRAYNSERITADGIVFIPLSEWDKIL